MSKKIILTEDQYLQVEALAAYLTTEQIADYFGINRDTFNEIMKRQPEVLRAYKAGKSKVVSEIAGNLVELCREKNLQAIIFYLKTQAGWRETQQIEHSGSVDITLTRTVIDP